MISSSYTCTNNISFSLILIKRAVSSLPILKSFPVRKLPSLSYTIDMTFSTQGWYHHKSSWKIDMTFSTQEWYHHKSRWKNKSRWKMLIMAQNKLVELGTINLVIFLLGMILKYVNSTLLFLLKLKKWYVISANIGK